jgi:1-acyl-sn-glycerol-3-phosphate acyltransferase
MSSRIDLDALRSTAMWGASIAWSFPVLNTLTVLQSVARPEAVDWLSRVYCRGQIRLLCKQWRAEVHSAVRPDRPYLFVQNHVNHFDHCVLYPATPHFKQGIELAEHFRVPLYGWFMKSRGTIGIEPGSVAALKEFRLRFEEEVRLGRSILAFPEGTRTLDGRVAPFQPGLFHIARELELPVVPVAVTGWYEVMRKGSTRVRRGDDVTVWVDEPVETKGLRRRDVRALADRVHATVARRVDAYWETHGLP